MRKAIQHLKTADPALAAVIEKVGPYRMQYIPPTFHSLVRSIVYQQLSGGAAATIFGRLVAATSNPVRPDTILALSFDQMRALGLSKQKAAYVRDLAAKTAAGGVLFEKLRRLSDQRIIDTLTEVKGIGVWTVHMFLIFALRRPNVLPTGDLGIRNAVQRVYGLKATPKPGDIEKIAERWHPYCSVATWYLWRSLELSKSKTAGAATP
jgi:DNA-3-methyladenine glycosylase II